MIRITYEIKPVETGFVLASTIHWPEGTTGLEQFQLPDPVWDTLLNAMIAKAIYEDLYALMYVPPSAILNTTHADDPQVRELQEQFQNLALAHCVNFDEAFPEGI